MTRFAFDTTPANTYIEEVVISIDFQRGRTGFDGDEEVTRRIPRPMTS